MNFKNIVRLFILLLTIPSLVDAEQPLKKEYRKVTQDAEVSAQIDSISESKTEKIIYQVKRDEIVKVRVFLGEILERKAFSNSILNKDETGIKIGDKWFGIIFKDIFIESVMNPIDFIFTTDTFPIRNVSVEQFKDACLYIVQNDSATKLYFKRLNNLGRTIRIVGESTIYKTLTSDLDSIEIASIKDKKFRCIMEGYVSSDWIEIKNIRKFSLPKNIAPPVFEPEQKNKTWVYVLKGAIVVLILLVLGFLIWKNWNKRRNNKVTDDPEKLQEVKPGPIIRFVELKPGELNKLGISEESKKLIKENFKINRSDNYKIHVQEISIKIEEIDSFISMYPSIRDSIYSDNKKIDILEIGNSKQDHILIQVPVEIVKIQKKKTTDGAKIEFKLKDKDNFYIQVKNIFEWTSTFQTEKNTRENLPKELEDILLNTKEDDELDTHTDELETVESLKSKLGEMEVLLKERTTENENLNKKNKNLESQLNEYEKKKNEEITQIKNKNHEKDNQQKADLKSLESKKADLENNWKETKEILATTKTELESIRKSNENMKEQNQQYMDCVVFVDFAGDYALKAKRFLNLAHEIEKQAYMLSNNIGSTNTKASFFINKSFTKYMSIVLALDVASWERELIMIANKKLIFTDSKIYKYSESKVGDINKNEGLIFQLYNELFAEYCSAVLILNEEFAGLDILADIDKSDLDYFNSNVENILLSIRDLNLNVEYISLFSSLLNQKNVDGVKKIKINIPTLESGDIVEIIKYAILYGNAIDRTQVVYKE